MCCTKPVHSSKEAYEPKKKDAGWYDGWTSAYTVESVLIQL